MKFNSEIPEGILSEKWTKHKFNLNKLLAFFFLPYVIVSVLGVPQNPKP